MSENFPAMIGKYKVEGIIAKGGMGVVYKAVHPSLKRYVVIKKMSGKKSSKNMERFKREAQILLDLNSPHIVHLFDYFTEASFRYMVEEFVDGMSLDKVLEKQKVLSPQLALLILQEACFALKYAHSKEIVHRDIKPGNILISKKAEIKLADFGIATGEKDSSEDSITETGVALGTPAYMPPEQYEDSAAVDKRADIYALGVMLYEMVTGTKPFPSTLSIETLNTIRKGKYIPPEKIDKTIPPVVCRLVKKMLKPKPKQRFQSTEQVLKIIKRYIKRYNAHSIRVELARIILSKNQYKEIVYVPVDKKRRKIFAITACACAVALSVASCWHLGFVHRYILRKWFTPVSIEMMMPSTSAAGLDLPVRAFFYENDGKDIPEVKNSRRIFKMPKEQIKNAKNLIYVTKSVYLRHGAYRVKVAAGSYVWWDSFHVDKNEMTIKNDFLKNARRPLKFNPHAYDKISGKEITDICRFKFLYNGFWQDFSDIPQDKLLTGTVWKIRVFADGYESENFSLLLDWYQDELFLSAKLAKLSG